MYWEGVDKARKFQGVESPGRVVSHPILKPLPVSPLLALEWCLRGCWASRLEADSQESINAVCPSAWSKEIVDMWWSSSPSRLTRSDLGSVGSGCAGPAEDGE